jgi:hypothetical protein
MKALPVNCDPWSVLKTSGFPFLSVSSNASTQESAAGVFDTYHASTYRLYQSMMVIRYMKPCAMGTFRFREGFFAFYCFHCNPGFKIRTILFAVLLQFPTPSTICPVFGDSSVSNPLVIKQHSIF